MAFNVETVRHVLQVGQEVGLGREWVREPRLSLVGAEREQILKIIRQGIAARPPMEGR